MSFVRPRVVFVLLVFCFYLGLTIAQDPVLRGSSELVLEVRQALTEKGYDPGPPGLSGPASNE